MARYALYTKLLHAKNEVMLSYDNAVVGGKIRKMKGFLTYYECSSWLVQVRLSHRLGGRQKTRESLVDEYVRGRKDVDV